MKALRLSDWLQLAYFGLMGLGLLLASFFLWEGKLTGSDWVAVCSVLFTADRAAQAFTARGSAP